MLRFTVKLMSETGRLVDHICKRWLVSIRETNPSILDMFRDRDVQPYRDLLPWSGEFAGKHLTSAQAIYKLNGDRELFDSISQFIDELIDLQSEDGYLGCYQKNCRLTGAFSDDPETSGKTWDAWSHYHILYGLFLWYKETRNERYWRAILKAADLFLGQFYSGRKRLISIGSSEMNLAVLHIFAILYQETQDQKYLDFALEIEQDLSHEAAGNYIHHALSGREYYECPKPRWESLHVIMGIAELYTCTGNTKYLQVARQIFYSILKTDVHNTGAFSTDEQAIGHPFKNAAIETCCVVAYNALACQLLRFQNELRIADFLELSFFNAVKGSFSNSGRWSTYNTPMDGERLANYHSIVFQSRPGSPDLNCCSVNAPRGVGLLNEWMIREQDGVVYINYFEDFIAEADSGLRIEVTGGYPGQSRILIRLFSPQSQKIAIRIPQWSKNTTATLNDSQLAPAPGTYLMLNQQWDHDTIYIGFDFAARFLDGDFAYRGMQSLYIGPVLYGYDVSENPAFELTAIPAIPYADIAAASPQAMQDGRLLLKLNCGITLKDFYHLGQSGCQYKTWLKYS